MTLRDIEHYLVVHDMANGRTEVRRFGTDYEAAQSAYADVEWETREDANIDAVLLSADSLETVKRTHSSYFERRQRFEHLLPPGILPTG
ncbi:MAG TPA: hypothetical protein VGO48_16280 [Conexibacter sp.]|jgi:hypothetical protein|nr:hypothetical protein [Conexibacter sp.]